ncbi:MAG: tRNA-dihydrouridine synthase [Collinsella sp.]
MAPMAGVTDAAYRIMCRRRGAEMAYTEMVSVAGPPYTERQDLGARGTGTRGAADLRAAVRVPSLSSSRTRWMPSQERVGDKLVAHRHQHGVPCAQGHHQGRRALRS